MTTKMTPAKKPAKKPVKKTGRVVVPKAKKKAPEPYVLPDNFLHKMSGRVEELSMDLEKASAIIRLIQDANLFPGDNSSALWAVEDVISQVQANLDKVVGELMEQHKHLRGITYDWSNY